MAVERLTLNNLVYTETYMDLLNSVDPYRLQFMDESGFRLPEVGNPLYGHAPKGQDAVEVTRYHSPGSFHPKCHLTLTCRYRMLCTCFFLYMCVLTRRKITYCFEIQIHI